MNKIVIALMLLVLAGCRTQQIDITEADNIHDTCFILRVLHDSIEVHDSTYCHIYEQGDTIFINKEKWHTKYKEVAKHDTVYIHKCDTITITKTMQQEQKTPWYQRLFDSVLTMILIAIGLVIMLFSLFRFKG